MGLDLPGGLFKDQQRAVIEDEDGTPANVNAGVLSTPTEVSTLLASVLRERWQQTGSTLINIEAVLNANSTIYTVTGGKTLFVKQIIISIETTQDTTAKFTLDDNGTDKITIAMDSQSEGTTLTLNFIAPLEFDTDIGRVSSIGGNAYITILGWEE